MFMKLRVLFDEHKQQKQLLKRVRNGDDISVEELSAKMNSWKDYPKRIYTIFAAIAGFSALFSFVITLAIIFSTYIEPRNSLFYFSIGSLGAAAFISLIVVGFLEQRDNSVNTIKDKLTSIEKEQKKEALINNLKTQGFQFVKPVDISEVSGEVRQLLDMKTGKYFLGVVNVKDDNTVSVWRSNQFGVMSHVREADFYVETDVDRSDEDLDGILEVVPSDKCDDRLIFRQVMHTSSSDA